MVDTGKKIDQIIKLIEDGLYFTISRPRQYGKTTTIYLLEERLKKDYILISTSFEGLGVENFSNAQNFFGSFVHLINKALENSGNGNILIKCEKLMLETLSSLSDLISEFVSKADRKVVLIIDEVDKASNYELFINFLGMLRNKYLSAVKNQDQTFFSVILAGVHDIKNIKLKMRPDGETSFNSPWNIAIDFKVDLSFSSEEIAIMLIDYENEHHTGMNTKDVSVKLYQFTSGYPYLVSKLCYIIDSELEKDFTQDGIVEAVKIILEDSSNSLFDDIIKNIENNKELYDLIKAIVLEDRKITFSYTEPLISLAAMYGIIKNCNKTAVIHNVVFANLLYDHFIAKAIRERSTSQSSDYRSNFIDDNDNINMEMVLIKFQELMKAEHRTKDEKFIEREGRLIFLAFLKPIINGTGFYFVEPQTRLDNRMDVIVTYNSKKYIIELKIWRGEKYRQDGVKQLSKYLEFQDVKRVT
jgi:hypothetical protein